MFGLVGAVGVVGRFVAAALVEAAYCCITAALPNACKPPKRREIMRNLPKHSP